MHDVQDYRIRHLEVLKDSHGLKALADKLDRSPSQISQMVGATKFHRSLTTDMARDFEARLGLPVGHFDTPIDIEPGTSITERLVAAGFPPARVRKAARAQAVSLAEVTVLPVQQPAPQNVLVAPAPAAPAPAAPAPAAQTMTPDQLRDLILLIGQVCEAENVSLPATKFSDIAALALVDAIEHDNKPRPDHVKTLVRLAK